MSPDLTLAPMWYVAFLLAITCHEGAHALAAKLGGDLTAYEEGQVTLNPIPHVRREPFGTILVPLLSYFIGGWMIGWASAPYDPDWQRRYPHRAGWMALAGPAANLLLVVLAGIAIHIFIGMGYLEQPQSINFTRVVQGISGGASGLAVFLSILFSLNLLLMAFNLLPVPPLDGATIVGLFMDEERALRFAEFCHNPTFSLIGIVVAWNVFDHLFDPVFTASLNILYPGAGYH